MLLKDKVAIITGGSRGIGFAIAEDFIKEGANVIICASREETATKAVTELKEKYPDAKVKAIIPDLTSLESVSEAYDGALAEYGRVDVLVNNAGISDDVALQNYTEEHYEKVMDVNVKGVFNSIKAASKYMMEQQSGAIVNISSVVSRDGQPGGFAYPTSKFAVNGMTLSFARELAPKGIRVNAVGPGITYTDMMRAVPEEYIAPLIKKIPLGRLGQPEDIANAVTFLASDKASYITGQIIFVDGLVRL
ncbi:MAG: 3-oxoacyl-ACP reductase family protein [Erysipelotrichaceae bacterium]|nr:3-oxoacyl-ACP reductase family protein [Erysipelotrichaceae bacterium]